MDSIPFNLEFDRSSPLHWLRRIGAGTNGKDKNTEKFGSNIWVNEEEY